MDKHFKKKQMQFGEKRTDKHFEKQTNVVLGKNKRTNILKNSICNLDKHFVHFCPYSLQLCAFCEHLIFIYIKRTDKNFEKQTNVVLGKNKRTNISKKSKCSFEKSSFKKKNGQTFQKKANAVWRKLNG